MTEELRFGDGDKTPPVLLPYQQAWVADKSEVKVCEKSRRIGLTWAEAADDVLLAATEGRGGMDVLYISYNQEMTREYIDTCAFWARHFNKAAGEIEEFLFEDEDKDIKAYRITFSSGYEILALSSSPKNLRGKQGRLIIDEAAFVELLKELLKAAMAYLMWGGGPGGRCRSPLARPSTRSGRTSTRACPRCMRPMRPRVVRPHPVPRGPGGRHGQDHGGDQQQRPGRRVHFS